MVSASDSQMLAKIFQNSLLRIMAAPQTRISW
jgi:hypothetical protein